MSKIILHNGRCGSTYLDLVMDRYYRAVHGDTSEGTFEQVFNRTYDLDNCKYLGLNEFLVPELVDASIADKLILTGKPGIKGGKYNYKGTFDLLDSIEKTKDHIKTVRRDFITKYMKTHTILLKYPLLSNPAPAWQAESISCERKDLKKQTISLYLSMATGHYVFKKGDRKVEKLRRFTPDEDTVNRWMVYVEKNNEKYRKLLPTNCKRVFMEDIEHQDPFEVLEWVGIKDWSDYLNKDFCVPIQKGWSS